VHGKEPKEIAHPRIIAIAQNGRPIFLSTIRKAKMSKNTNLQQAKSAKADEFYTQLTDIEKELRHYRGHFKGAIILVKCYYDAKIQKKMNIRKFI